MTGAGARAALEQGGRGRHGAARRLADFVALLKPKPMSVVILTALAGLVAAPLTAAMPERTIASAAAAMLAIALAGGGAAVLNMWFEHDLDARMARTANRPIPAGRVSPGEALAFAVLLIAAGLGVMASAAGPVATLMLALTAGFYGIVYTMWLKRATALNVVVGGGLASLLTPLTGWAAATGSVSLEALAVFAFLVPWTPPHVWSQALVREADYARAGVPMMPVVAGSARTRWMIAGFTVAHALLTLLPVWLGYTGAAWLAVALLGGAALSFEAFRLARMSDDETARRAAWKFYRHNSIYVVALLAALVSDRVWLSHMLPIH